MHDFNCAVCGNSVTDEDCGHCFTCGWDGDTVQENEPDYRGGANKISLNEAREKWAARSARPGNAPARKMSYAAHAV